MLSQTNLCNLYIFVMHVAVTMVFSGLLNLLIFWKFIYFSRRSEQLSFLQQHLQLFQDYHLLRLSFFHRYQLALLDWHYVTMTAMMIMKILAVCMTISNKPSCRLQHYCSTVTMNVVSTVHRPCKTLQLLHDAWCSVTAIFQ